MIKAGEYEALGFRAAEEARSGADGRRPAQGGSGDSHLRYDRETLVKESQRFDRDNGLYQGVINRAVDNIVGSGFTLQVKTPDKTLNQQVEGLWKEFWESPEIRGMDSGYDCERKTLRHLFVDGDVGAIKTTLGLFQLIESEQIASGRNGRINQYQQIEQGVYLNRYGRPLAFDVCEYDSSGYVQKGLARRIDASDFIFLANRPRISQTRGTPLMTSNFSMFHRINDICDSEAIAWQLLARFALMISREDGPGKAFDESAPDTGKNAPEKLPARIQEFDAATIFQARKGEKLAAIARELPGANFPESITMFIRLLGLPIGFPLELILLDWSKTNYSSARAALEQAFRMFTTWQKRLIAGFHSPIFRWKVQQWIADRKLPASMDLVKHQWLTPAFPWIDQLKEAMAWGERMDRGLTTQTAACKSVNIDRDEWLIERAAEIAEAIEAADKLNKQYPSANVDWRMLAGMGDKPNVNVTLGPDETGGDDGDPVKNSKPKAKGNANGKRAKKAA